MGNTSQLVSDHTSQPVSNTGWGFYILKYEEGSNLVNAAEVAVADLQAALQTGDYAKAVSAINTLNGLTSGPDFQSNYPDLNSNAVQSFMSGIANTLTTQVLPLYSVSFQGQVIGTMAMNPNTSEGGVMFNHSYEEKDIGPGMSVPPGFPADLQKVFASVAQMAEDNNASLVVFVNGIEYTITGVPHDTPIPGGGGVDTDVIMTISASAPLSSWAAQDPGSVTISGPADGTQALTNFINSF